MLAFVRVLGIYVLIAAALTWALFAFGLAEDMELPGFDSQKPPTAAPVILGGRSPQPPAAPVAVAGPEPKRSAPDPVRSEPAPPPIVARAPEAALSVPPPTVQPPVQPKGVTAQEVAPIKVEPLPARPVSPAGPSEPAVPKVAVAPPPSAPPLPPVKAVPAIEPARQLPAAKPPVLPPPETAPAPRATAPLPPPPTTRAAEAAPVLPPEAVQPPRPQPAPAAPAAVPSRAPVGAAAGPRRTWAPMRRVAGFGPDALLDQLEDATRRQDDIPCVVFDQVRFKATSADPLRASQRQIDIIAATLALVPAARVEVGSRIGTTRMTLANQRLAAQRARYVHDALVRRGIEAERLSMDLETAYHELMDDVGRVSGNRPPSIGICVLPARS